LPHREYKTYFFARNREEKAKANSVIRKKTTTRVFTGSGKRCQGEYMSSSLSLSPTARMILHILAGSPKPLSKMELVTATGASLYTVVPLIQLLSRNNLVSRTIVGKTAYYCLPVAADQGGQ
jgi:hypothetical protein